MNSGGQIDPAVYLVVERLLTIAGAIYLTYLGHSLFKFGVLETDAELQAKPLLRRLLFSGTGAGLFLMFCGALMLLLVTWLAVVRIAANPNFQADAITESEFSQPNPDGVARAAPKPALASELPLKRKNSKALEHKTAGVMKERPKTAAPVFKEVPRVPLEEAALSELTQARDWPPPGSEGPEFVNAGDRSEENQTLPGRAPGLRIAEGESSWRSRPNEIELPNSIENAWSPVVGAIMQMTTPVPRSTIVLAREVIE